MKKKLAIVLVMLVFATVLGIILVKILKTADPALPYPEDFPPVELSTIDFNELKQEALFEKTLLMFFYSPGCMFCEHEIKELQRNNRQIEGNVLFISSAPLDSIYAYTNRYRLDTIPHYHIIFDENHRLYRQFYIDNVPSTLIYGKDRRLIKAFRGEVNAKKIIETIHNANI